MESVESHAVADIITEFDDLIKNPEEYIEQQIEKSERFKQVVKKIYNLTVKSNILTDLKSKSLSKLLIDGFDEEQIFQQIEIQNKAAVPHFSKILPKLDSKNIIFAVNRNNVSLETATTEDHAFSDDDSNIEEEYVFDDDSDSSVDVVKPGKKDITDSKKENYAFDDDSESSLDVVKSNEKAKKSNKKEDYAFDDDSNSSTDLFEITKIGKNAATEECASNINPDISSTGEAKTARRESTIRKKQSTTKKSQVDDQFFKLSKLEEFLKIEDLKEGKEVEEESDDEDDIDLFQDIPSDDMDECDEESDEDEGKTKKSSKDIMYEDFFDAPESGDENTDNTMSKDGIINGKEDEDSDQNSENTPDEEMWKEDEYDAEMEAIDQNNKLEIEDALGPLDSSPQKTTFEIEQEKIRKKIQECEKSMLKPLPWHLTGEVDASNRPVDSLVHKDTDFDSNVKKDLIIDQDFTEKVENIIKMAIINKAFCDVERKIKPTAEVITYKREMALEQTKSKKSLAQVYEEDYLKKQSKQEEEENPKHKEIKKLMDSLLPELHALFSHIPKPAIPEIKIVSNLPAITVEEVAPTSVSDVTLLAPEEVKAKSGLVKGQTERTDTDRKRERRKKKIHQRLKEKKRQEKLESRKADPSAKISKLEKMENLKKLKQNKNTKIATVDEGGKIKSSKDFFSRLQDTMDMKTKSKTQVPYKKRKS